MLAGHTPGISALRKRLQDIAAHRSRLMFLDSGFGDLQGDLQAVLPSTFWVSRSVARRRDRSKGCELPSAMDLFLTQYRYPEQSASCQGAVLSRILICI